ncbi:MAG: VanW family protein [Candidatus Peribacteraceae bacterium]|nr:VanW family protein [Candidatus Peribacteraceae bacterium]
MKKNKNKHYLGVPLALLGIGFFFIFGPTRQSSFGSPAFDYRSGFALHFGNVAALAFMREEPPPSSPFVRVAQRLQRRLAQHQLVIPPLSQLVSALEELRSLQRQRVVVALETATNPAYGRWEVNLQKYPSWISPSFTETEAHFRLDEQRMRDYLMREGIEGVIPPKGITLTEVKQEKEIQRVITDDIARAGYVANIPETVEMLSSALTQGVGSGALLLTESGGPIHNTSGQDLGALTLLGTGRSDFRGSPGARISNVQKALREHVSNTLVPPGATFSFNATLDGPVTESRGWKLAKVIFEGSELRMAPGGGICQASTTVFRAIVSAGFTVQERANHSLYVSYYEKYGVGIDATVFPGQQDLTFVNDSGNYLLLQAYDEGTEAVVNIYGTPDGRIVDLRGPFFAGREPADFSYAGRNKLKGNEIAWVQNVTRADGKVEQNVIISRYTGMPASIPRKYALHASAIGQ